MNMRLYKILSRKGCFLTPNRSFFGEFVIQNPVIKVTSWTCQKNRKFVHSSLRLPETETCMQIVWCDADLISAVYNIVISHGLLDIWIQHFEKLRKFVVVVPFCFISILDPIFADVPPFVGLLSNEAWLRVFFGSLRGNPYTGKLAIQTKPPQIRSPSHQAPTQAGCSGDGRVVPGSRR